MPLIRGEGPFALILVPSRELANQTFETIKSIANFLHKKGYPYLKCAVCIGGMD